MCSDADALFATLLGVAGHIPGFEMLIYATANFLPPFRRRFDHYGYPGDGINECLGALDRADDTIEFIEAPHEELCAFTSGRTRQIHR